MVLELLDQFHLGYISHLIVGYAILETSLQVFRRLSGLIKIEICGSGTSPFGARRELQRGGLAVAFLNSCSNTSFARLDAAG